MALTFSILHAGMFEKGNKNVSGSIGAGSSYGNTYTVVGVSTHYFIIDNLALGMGYRGWFGSNPIMNELLIDGTYFLPLNQKFRPYLGAFMRQTFVSENDDYQSYGAKAGLAISTSPNSYVGIAYVLEYYNPCNSASECSNAYPEVILGLSF
jgi:outer membrane protein W